MMKAAKLWEIVHEDDGGQDFGKDSRCGCSLSKESRIILEQSVE